MKNLLKILVLLVTNLTFAQDAEVVSNENPENTEKIYKIEEVTTKPAFPGGIEFFYAFVEKNFVVPDQKGLIGKVFVAFVVEKDGTLTNFNVLRDAGFGTGKEAIRVMELSPKWSPAIKDGKTVRSIYTIPIAVSHNTSAPPKK